MQKNTKRTGSKFTPKARGLAIMISGHKTIIPDSRQISFAGSVHCHGTTANGTEVKSARYKHIGDSTVIWPAGKGEAFAMPTADAEVMAVKLAIELGYEVTHKGTSAAS